MTQRSTDVAGSAASFRKAAVHAPMTLLALTLLTVMVGSVCIIYWAIASSLS